MQDRGMENSGSWHLFTVVSFVVAASMMAGGIYYLEASFSAKGFYAMASLMLVHTSISLTKSLRDKEEFLKVQNRTEEQRVEKLLRNKDKEDAE